MRFKTTVAIVVAAMAVASTQVAWAAPVKKADSDGKPPAKWDQAKPQVKGHSDKAPETAGGTGDGKNSISFSAFDDGDIIVVLGTSTGHAGEWDDAYHYSDRSACVWSANTTPGNDVLREAAIKYRAYDRAYGLWVPSVSAANRAKARSYCRSQNGEPYLISSSKTDQSRWYCSKLAWSSYKYTAGVDLDGDGGYWVWPVDLINDSQTALFVSAS